MPMPPPIPGEDKLPRYGPPRGVVLRETVLSHIRWVEPRPVPVIHAHVVEDYGSVAPRSVWRHVRRLVEDGLITKVYDDSEDIVGYVRTKPPQLSEVDEIYI